MKTECLKPYILVISLCIGLSVKAHDFEVGGIYYNVIPRTDMTVEVTSRDDNYNSYSGDIDIPAEVEYDNMKFRVTSVGYYAFGGCHALTSVIIPEGVTSIGSYAFGGCHALTSVIIPEGVTSIGSYAFYDCTALTSINIPDGITSIETSTFSNCSRLESVILPYGIKSIGYGAFYQCSRLSYIIIPDGVTYIGECAFQGCTVLPSINLPDRITHIGPFAFSNCPGLTSIIIPGSVTHIDRNTFANCKGLTSVIIPDGVTSISSDAFLCCTGLTYVSLSKTINEIRGSFKGCVNITQYRIFNPVPPKCSTFSFSDIRKFDCTLYVPIGSKEAYSQDLEWGEFLKIEEFEPGGINDVGIQPVKVTTTDNQIIVDGSDDNEMVSVCGANGQQMYNGTDKTIEVPASGLYIVKVNGKVFKVII